MRKFGPRPADARPGQCLACHKDFKMGDYTTLVPLGPGDDEEARQRARESLGYVAVAVEVHVNCADPRYVRDE
jgi:hypothetical protein